MPPCSRRPGVLARLRPSIPSRSTSKLAARSPPYERSAEVNTILSAFDGFWREARNKGLDPAAITAANARSFEGLGLPSFELKGLFCSQGRPSAPPATAWLPSTASRRSSPITGTTISGCLRTPRTRSMPWARSTIPKGISGLTRGWADSWPASPSMQRMRPQTWASTRRRPSATFDLRPSPSVVKAYMHNGFFTDLKAVVRFYNTSDAVSAGWPKPEVGANLNTSEVGKLGLSGAAGDSQP